MNHPGPRPSARQRLALLLAASLPLAAALPAHAQADADKRPIRIIVTAAPGTVPDSIARTLAQGLQELRQRTMVVENKQGASSVIAAETAIRATPDGTTVFLANDSIMTVQPLLQAKLPFDVRKDLKPIAPVAFASLVLLAHSSLKVRNFAEFVALAKSKPGGLDYATFGNGTSHHRSMALTQHVAGITLNHIPYGSKGPMNDVLAGTVPVMWSGLSSAMAGISAGTLVPLAISGPTRSPSLPAVPTMIELGYPEFEVGNWYGVMGQATLPPAIAKQLEDDILAVTSSPAFKQRIVAQGLELMPGTASVLTQRIRVDLERNAKLFATLQLKE